MGFFDELFATANKGADTYANVQAKIRGAKTPIAPEPSLSRGMMYGGPATPSAQPISLAGFGVGMPAILGFAVIGVLVLLLLRK